MADELLSKLEHVISECGGIVASMNVEFKTLFDKFDEFAALHLSEVKRPSKRPRGITDASNVTEHQAMYLDETPNNNASLDQTPINRNVEIHLAGVAYVLVNKIMDTFDEPNEVNNNQDRNPRFRKRQPHANGTPLSSKVEEPQQSPTHLGAKRKKFVDVSGMDSTVANDLNGAFKTVTREMPVLKPIKMRKIQFDALSSENTFGSKVVQWCNAGRLKNLLIRQSFVNVNVTETFFSNRPVKVMNPSKLFPEISSEENYRDESSFWDERAKLNQQIKS